MDTRRKRRISSILKKSPSRTALEDIDNIELDEPTYTVNVESNKKRCSRRVSFANSDQIKEIARAVDIANDWEDSSSVVSDSGSKNVSVSNLLLQPIQRPNKVQTSQENMETNSTSISNLNKLLSAPIVKETIVQANVPSTLYQSSFFDNSLIPVTAAHVETPEVSPNASFNIPLKMSTGVMSEKENAVPSINVQPILTPATTISSQSISTKNFLSSIQNENGKEKVIVQQGFQKSVQNLNMNKENMPGACEAPGQSKPNFRTQTLLQFLGSKNKENIEVAKGFATQPKQKRLSANECTKFVQENEEAEVDQPQTISQTNNDPPDAHPNNEIGLDTDITAKFDPPLNSTTVDIRRSIGRQTLVVTDDFDFTECIAGPAYSDYPATMDLKNNHLAVPGVAAFADVSENNSADDTKVKLLSEIGSAKKSLNNLAYFNAKLKEVERTQNKALGDACKGQHQDIEYKAVLDVTTNEVSCMDLTECLPQTDQDIHTALSQSKAMDMTQNLAIAMNLTECLPSVGTVTNENTGDCIATHKPKAEDFTQNYAMAHDLTGCLPLNTHQSMKIGEDKWSAVDITKTAPMELTECLSSKKGPNVGTATTLADDITQNHADATAMEFTECLPPKKIQYMNPVTDQQPVGDITENIAVGMKLSECLSVPIRPEPTKDITNTTAIEFTECLSSNNLQKKTIANQENSEDMTQNLAVGMELTECFSARKLPVKENIREMDCQHPTDKSEKVSQAETLLVEKSEVVSSGHSDNEVPHENMDVHTDSPSIVETQAIDVDSPQDMKKRLSRLRSSLGVYTARLQKKKEQSNELSVIVETVSSSEDESKSKCNSTNKSYHETANRSAVTHNATYTIDDNLTPGARDSPIKPLGNVHPTPDKTSEDIAPTITVSIEAPMKDASQDEANHTMENSKPIDASSITIGGTWGEQMFMVNDDKSSKNIEISKFLEIYTDVPMNKNLPHRPSTLHPIANQDEPTLSTKLNEVSISAKEHTLCQVFSQNMQNAINEVKEAMDELESQMNGSNPDIVKFIRFGENENEKNLYLEKLETLALFSKSLGKAHCKKAKAKLYKGLAQSLTRYKDGELKESVEMIQEWKEIRDTYLQQINADLTGIQQKLDDIKSKEILLEDLQKNMEEEKLQNTHIEELKGEKERAVGLYDIMHAKQKEINEQIQLIEKRKEQIKQFKDNMKRYFKYEASAPEAYTKVFKFLLGSIVLEAKEKTDFYQCKNFEKIASYVVNFIIPEFKPKCEASIFQFLHILIKKRVDIGNINSGSAADMKKVIRTFHVVSAPAMHLKRELNWLTYYGPGRFDVSLITLPDEPTSILVDFFPVAEGPYNWYAIEFFYEETYRDSLFDLSKRFIPTSYKIRNSSTEKLNASLKEVLSPMMGKKSIREMTETLLKKF